ncbi:unnamed protein product [Dovyalis caffra]|uniref:Uncharacterized protein n=1 Tax=Dovyalis caffra TaxID=77055 RepID=A0AAV1QTZ5_9ROSI|nr:unnamed protein product [Dovyalis caffra]
MRGCIGFVAKLLQRVVTSSYGQWHERLGDEEVRKAIRLGLYECVARLGEEEVRKAMRACKGDGKGCVWVLGLG